MKLKTQQTMNLELLYIRYVASSHRLLFFIVFENNDENPEISVRDLNLFSISLLLSILR